MQFDHAGVATRETESLVGLYADLLGARIAHEESVDGVAVTFLDCGNGHLELLEPREGGVIDEYLVEHGSGVHHLAFRTADLEGALDRARNLGVELVDERPRAGARGHEVAFLHPDSTGGVLVEFVAA